MRRATNASHRDYKALKLVAISPRLPLFVDSEVAADKQAISLRTYFLDVHPVTAASRLRYMFAMD
jgi:hypothetical protein